MHCTLHHYSIAVCLRWLGTNSNSTRNALRLLASELQLMFKTVTCSGNTRIIRSSVTWLSNMMQFLHLLIFSTLFTLKLNAFWSSIDCLSLSWHGTFLFLASLQLFVERIVKFSMCWTQWGSHQNHSTVSLVPPKILSGTKLWLLHSLTFYFNPQAAKYLLQMIQVLLPFQRGLPTQ